MTAIVVPPLETAASWAAPSIHGQTRHDGGTRCHQRRRDPGGERPPGARGTPRPDNGDRMTWIERRAIAEDEQKMRGQVDGRETSRIGRVGHGHDRQAQGVDPSERPAAVERRVGDGGRESDRDGPQPCIGIQSGPRRRGSQLPDALRSRRDAKDLPATSEPAKQGAQPIGPRPSTPARIAQASRSSEPGSGRPRALSSASGPAALTPNMLQTARALAARCSDARYQADSSRCSARRTSSPARSAIVRATRSSRSVPRPVARSRSASPTTGPRVAGVRARRPYPFTRPKRPARDVPGRPPGFTGSSRVRGEPLGTLAAPTPTRAAGGPREREVQPVPQRARLPLLLSLRDIQRARA